MDAMPQPLKDAADEIYKWIKDSILSPTNNTSNSTAASVMIVHMGILRKYHEMMTTTASTASAVAASHPVTTIMTDDDGDYLDSAMDAIQEDDVQSHHLRNQDMNATFHQYHSQLESLATRQYSQHQVHCQELHTYSPPQYWAQNNGHSVHGYNTNAVPTTMQIENMPHEAPNQRYVGNERTLLPYIHFCVVTEIIHFLYFSTKEQQHNHHHIFQDTQQVLVSCLEWLELIITKVAPDLQPLLSYRLGDLVVPMHPDEEDDDERYIGEEEGHGPSGRSIANDHLLDLNTRMMLRLALYRLLPAQNRCAV